MFRSALVVALLGSLSAVAEAPKFQSGGFTFQLQYGPGFWALDQAKLAGQVDAKDPGGAETFIAQAQNSHTVSVKLAYNILGHASIGAELTATGWNLFDPTRGGAGFAIGEVAWHPLQLIFMNKEVRPIPLDVSTFFGLGYGIAGQARGMDGLLLEWGLNADWFFTRYFAVGVFVRGVFFDWSSYYIDFNNRSTPGATIALPQTSGGAFWTFGLALTLRAGD